MICFPNAKINLGLRVLRKREDGYHDIESVFLPVQWCDALEIVKWRGKGSEKISWKNFGLDIPGNPEENLIAKAYYKLDAAFGLPPVTINLLKQIPMGAGMGGGSSDGAFALKLINELFNLEIKTETLLAYAAELGADCSFFVHNKPAYLQGVGDKLDLIDFKLPFKYIFIVYPPYHISTSEAFQNMKPSDSYDSSLLDLLLNPIETWKNSISNDFEWFVFQKFPELYQLKDQLFINGAIYASMTGSGSAVYGFFNEKVKFEVPSSYYTKWLEVSL